MEGVLDASQRTSLEALLSIYKGEAIVLFDFAEHVKGKLGSKGMLKTLKMLEELTDYGRGFNTRGSGPIALP